MGAHHRQKLPIFTAIKIESPMAKSSAFYRLHLRNRLAAQRTSSTGAGAAAPAEVPAGKLSSSKSSTSKSLQSTSSTGAGAAAPAEAPTKKSSSRKSSTSKSSSHAGKSTTRAGAPAPAEVPAG